MKAQSLIESIISSQRPCFFVSPHLDDAILSAGSLLARLAEAVPVTLITVFTEASGSRPTLSQRNYLRLTNATDAGHDYERRRAEDRQVAKILKTNCSHLGYIDALWRKKNPSQRRLFSSVPSRKTKVMYPTYRFHIARGRITKADKLLPREIAQSLSVLIGESPKSVIFCPYGIGSHVDHLLTRNACELLPYPIIYWFDQPYAQHIKKTRSTASLTADTFRWAGDPEKKAALISIYASQIPSLFPKGITMPADETYYMAESEHGDAAW